MTGEIMDLLRQVPMFRDVVPEIRSALAARASIREYRRETELFDQGERAAVLYVLFEGSLQLAATGADARAAVIEVVTPSKSSRWPRFWPRRPTRWAQSWCSRRA